ncbi:MCE family protein [Gluconobacter cerinus]|uniref:Paraquat-inducible protein B n=1 Tax=Gluconobacter cerinus TaxID=38307 RepID=A0AAV5NES0_9PROT|nr:MULTISPECIES: MlaD family protein [Gluconobacter]MBS0984492.1 MCE family protein [Gluconobacter cerinus]MBS1024067.1 MCE family protein [Gluconobacter cerinus]MBS1029778.1 MCE family protein [Gluconobacter cerinus]MBS1034303.1 MCE family protein [Gluconobacter cerinus]MBS1038417.1 MCE family protein [Gluconobacter cerinus]
MNKQALVGAFVVGGIGLGVAAFVLFGNFHPFTRMEKAVLIFHGASSGLSVGAPVTFRGVQVGAVDKVVIEYNPQTRDAYIPVYVTMRPDNITLTNSSAHHFPTIRDLVSQGLRGEMNLKSFVTGSSEIDLDFAPDTPAVMHPDIATLTEIPTKQSSIQAMTQTLQNLPFKELGDNANATLAAVRELSDKLDRDMPTLIESIRATSDHSRDMIDASRDLVTHLQPELEHTLNSLNRLADAGSDQLTARGKELQALLLSSNQTIQKAGESLNNIQSITSPRSADRANLEASLRDIAAAASALRGFANDVERNPQLLLTGRH